MRTDVARILETPKSRLGLRRWPRGFNGGIAPSATYKKNEDIDGFWTRLEQRLEQVPGVQSSAFVSGLPPLVHPT